MSDERDDYRAWARREALVKRLECSALETAAEIDRQRKRKPPVPLSPRVAAEAEKIQALARAILAERQRRR
jgi:hypothetical protein